MSGSAGVCRLCGEFPVSGSLNSTGVSRSRALVAVLVGLVVTAFLALGMSAPASAALPSTLNVRVSNQAGELLTGLGNYPAEILAVPVSSNLPDLSNSIDGTPVTGN